MDWKNTYNCLADDHKSIRDKRLICQNRTLCEFLDSAKIADDDLYTASLMLQLTVTIPLHVDEEMQTKFETWMQGFYEQHEMLGTFAKMALIRFRITSKANPMPAEAKCWFWATILSHLLVLSTIDSENKLLRDATFLNAKYAGNHFTTFVYLLLTVNRCKDILPQSLVRYLHGYLQILKIEYQGYIDPKLWKN